MIKQILNFTFIILLFYSCQTDKDKKENVTETKNYKKINFISNAKDSAQAFNLCTGPGSRNYLVSKSDGEAMIKKFEDVFTKDVKGQVLTGMNKSFWIDACAINKLNSYLELNKKDGVRFIFSSKNNADTSTHFYIVPTSKTTDPQVHSEAWHYKISFQECNAASYFDLKNASEGVERFEYMYAQRSSLEADVYGRDSLSLKCWIDRCVIASLSEIVTNHPEIVDGVNVMLAAYDKLESGTGQKKPVQSTVILVPSENDSHRNVWEIPEFFIKINAKGVKAYNHSQLCPNLCN